MFFTSCYRGKYFGKLPVKNTEGLYYFNLYQDQEFDHAVAIYYEIVDQNDIVLHGPKFLIETNDFNTRKTNDFIADLYDSIIYLTFLDSNLIYAIYDLKTNKAIDLTNLLNRDTLLEIKIKEKNPQLKFLWYE